MYLFSCQIAEEWYKKKGLDGVRVNQLSVKLCMSLPCGLQTTWDGISFEERAGGKVLELQAQN